MAPTARRIQNGSGLEDEDRGLHPTSPQDGLIDSAAVPTLEHGIDSHLAAAEITRKNSPPTVTHTRSPIKDHGTELAAVDRNRAVGHHRAHQIAQCREGRNTVQGVNLIAQKPVRWRFSDRAVYAPIANMRVQPSRFGHLRPAGKSGERTTQVSRPVTKAPITTLIRFGSTAGERI